MSGASETRCTMVNVTHNIPREKGRSSEARKTFRALTEPLWIMHIEGNGPLSWFKALINASPTPSLHVRFFSYAPLLIYSRIYVSPKHEPLCTFDASSTSFPFVVSTSLFFLAYQTYPVQGWNSSFEKLEKFTSKYTQSSMSTLTIKSRESTIFCTNNWNNSTVHIKIREIYIYCVYLKSWGEKWNWRILKTRICGASSE